MQDLPDLLDLIPKQPVESVPQPPASSADLSIEDHGYSIEDEPPVSSIAYTDEALQAAFFRSDADNFAMWYSTTVILDSIGPVAAGFQIGQNSDGIIREDATKLSRTFLITNVIIDFKPPIEDKATSLRVADAPGDDQHSLFTKPLLDDSRLLTINELSRMRAKERLEVWEADAMIVDLHVALASESYLVPPPTLHLPRRKDNTAAVVEPAMLHGKRRHSDMV